MTVKKSSYLGSFQRIIYLHHLPLRSCARRQRILDLLYRLTTANWLLMTLGQSKFNFNLKIISLSLFLSLSLSLSNIF
jgi:hypothetical protein